MFRAYLASNAKSSSPSPTGIRALTDAEKVLMRSICVEMKEDHSYPPSIVFDINSTHCPVLNKILYDLSLRHYHKVGSSLGYLRYDVDYEHCHTIDEFKIYCTKESLLDTLDECCKTDEKTLPQKLGGSEHRYVDQKINYSFYLECFAGGVGACLFFVGLIAGTSALIYSGLGLLALAGIAALHTQYGFFTNISTNRVIAETNDAMGYRERSLGPL